VAIISKEFWILINKEEKMEDIINRIDGQVQVIFEKTDGKQQK
jgi:hypothetical protein